jgi:nucleotide-binding universal stress UspA family protein
MSSESLQLLTLKKILVSIDGSENATRAMKAAISIAKKFQSDLLILNVVAEMVPPVFSPIGVNVPAVDYSNYLERAENDAKKLVNDAVAGAKNESVNANGIVLRTVTSIAETILEEASKENVNLLVVGTRGLGGFKKLLLGSVSNAVVAHADCSVLVVR